MTLSCKHGKRPSYFCIECSEDKEKQRYRKYYQKNKEKFKVYNLISSYPERYPLDSECVFCGETIGLIHAHLDYEDDGHNYVTACDHCNLWMEKK